MCLINNLETIERNRTKENKCIIKGGIIWKISYRSKKNFQISTYILNGGWEITKNVLAKQKSSSNETKINNIISNFFILPSKWNVYVIKHLNWEY